MADYEWKRIFPGTYARDMDDVEIHYNLISNTTLPLGRQMWATSACVMLDFETNDFVGDVQSAWTMVRQQYPSIAVTTGDSKKGYKIIAGQAALNKWLDETVIVIEDEETATVFPRLSARIVEQSTLFVLPKTKEIILRITHENADGEGMIRVLDCLLENLAKTSHDLYPPDGSEVSRLSSCFAAGANLSTSNSDEGIAFAAQALREYASNLLGLGLPARAMDQLPTNGNRYDFAFSSEETAEMINAARAKGLTPFHVFQTASMMATYKLATDKTRKYATFGIFGLRKHCSEPVKSDPTSISIIGWPTVYEPPYDDFDALSAQVKSFYTGFASDPRLLSGLKPHWQMMKPALLPGAPPPAPASDPMISSLGVVDFLLQPLYRGAKEVEVKDFWMATNVMSANPAIHLWTWQGIMRYAVSYNETYYTREDIITFVDVVLEIVRANLLGELAHSA